MRSFDGTDLAYYVGGEGPPVLFATGLAANWRVWSHQIEYLLGRYRILAWDYRGLYHSHPPRDRAALTVEDHARDALAILQAERVDRAAFVGWSTGVQVGLELFRDVPERIAALVLIGGVAGAPYRSLAGAARRVLPGFVRGLRRVPSLVEAFVVRAAGWPETVGWTQRVGLAGASLDEELWRELAQSFAGNDMDVFLRMVECASVHDAHDVLSVVDVPTLVVSGDRDPMAPRRAAEHIVRRVAGAELMVIPGGTHYVAMEYPELVNLRIEKFFRERGYPPESPESRPAT